MAAYFGMACKRLGYQSHYFSMPDGKVDESQIDIYHETDIFAKDRIVEICRKENIDGVVATTELTVAIAAYVAYKLGLPGNPPEVAEAITNKYRNRECIKHLDSLLSPRYIRANSLAEIKTAGIPYPIILKPTGTGGKRGISVVDSAEKLESAFRYAASCFKPGITPEVIAEQFIDGGIECSVESISYNGRHTVVQITQKDSSGAPHCVELGHHQPAALSKEDWIKVVRGVTDGLKAIGLTTGCCHTEIKVKDRKVYLIEFNARPGGDHISYPMVELSTGYDFMAALVLAAMGELKDIDITKFKHHFSGLYYVVAQTACLKPIFDRCQDMDWCVEKNFISDRLAELTHNDMEHTNYMIYASDCGNPVAKLLGLSHQE